ncbi:hypothetical protein ACIPWE_10520 [Streptomyces sp. NPDC090073]|uniref:hypothetical protein n=1 Tax=Streptomyces sp. NPDC090073 TaxID=3365936 RepID=UPI0038108760
MTIDPKLNPVVAALPGGGWISEFGQEDGSIETYPLLAWLVLADGEMIPMDVSVNGYAQDPRDAGNFRRMIHPEATGVEDA